MKYRVVLILLMLSSCKKDEVILTPTEQLAHDIEIIDNYLASKGIVAVKDPSGLRYVVSNQGTGAIPTITSWLLVRYTIRLLPSEAFVEASPEPPEYIKSPLERLITGWQIAFTKLPVGTDVILYIPSGLAYGKNERSSVPANSILICNVQLIDFFDDVPVFDADGNSYSLLFISDKVWFDRNLQTTRFANGDLIAPAEWSYYNNDESYGHFYGSLYSFDAVADNRGVCPVGYQIPTKEDWEELALVYSNGNESNLTDYFRLLPGGVRAADGTFSGDGLKAVLWSSHEYSATDEALAFTFFMDNKELIGTVASKSAQVSIRCIKAH